MFFANSSNFSPENKIHEEKNADNWSKLSQNFRLFYVTEMSNKHMRNEVVFFVFVDSIFGRKIRRVFKKH